MLLDTQFKIKNNPVYQNYIRENSIWYKRLNRNPKLFNIFEEEAKAFYKLRPVDKITKAVDTMELISSLVSTLK